MATDPVEIVEFLRVAENAARRAGGILLDWAERFTVGEKGPADLVTEADFASQEAIREILLGQFPHHGFIGEEGNPAQGTSGFCWYVDPLDGTTNYVHQAPSYAVSIALAHDEDLLAGVVYDPVARECYTATQGGGAWLNGRRLTASRVDTLDRAMVAVSFPPRLTADAPQIADVVAVMLRAQAIRRMGSSALNLAYVAAGRYDAFWAPETKSWDVAAGVLLVHEAGGFASSISGQPFDLARPDVIVASSEPLYRELFNVLRSARGFVD